MEIFTVYFKDRDIAVFSTVKRAFEYAYRCENDPQSPFYGEILGVKRVLMDAEYESTPQVSLREAKITRGYESLLQDIGAKHIRDANSRLLKSFE